MLHMVTATAALWAASWALCQWGSTRHWQQQAFDWCNRFRAESAWHDVTKAALARERNEMHRLRGTRVEIQGPIYPGGLRIEVTLAQWRLIEDVLARKVRSTNPGCCFLTAGWRRCGVTKRRRLLILEAQPAEDGNG